MLDAGHNFGSVDSQPDVWLFAGSLQDLWNSDELLASMCGFFHVSSTSVSPGLKMGQLISFWTSVFWLFFLGYASCCPQKHFGDNNGLLVFKGAVGHHWLFVSSSIWHWICYEFLLNGRQQTEYWAVIAEEQAAEFSSSGAWNQSFL